MGSRSKDLLEGAMHSESDDSRESEIRAIRANQPDAL